MRCPRAELRPAPGRFRASVSRHYRPGREVLAGLGQVKAGNARKNCAASALAKGCDRTGANPKSQETWPEVAPEDGILFRAEPWWNADRRARPQRRGGASRSLRGAPRTRWCGQSHLGLSAFRFLRFLSFVLFSRMPFSFVIAGLDPAIHAAATPHRTFRQGSGRGTSSWTTGSRPVVTRRECVRRCLKIESEKPRAYRPSGVRTPTQASRTCW